MWGWIFLGCLCTQWIKFRQICYKTTSQRPNPSSPPTSSTTSTCTLVVLIILMGLGNILGINNRGKGNNKGNMGSTNNPLHFYQHHCAKPNPNTNHHHHHKAIVIAVVITITAAPIIVGTITSSTITIVVVITTIILLPTQ